MPWAFLVWVLCFWLQAVLVGFAFYTLIQLYDFEEDLTNNFDCAKRCNRLVIPELVIQCLVLLLSLSSGHIVAALLNFAGAALLVHRFVQGKHLLDSLELWKQLPQAKRTSYMKLAAFGGAFAFIMFSASMCNSWIYEAVHVTSPLLYRTIEIIVHEVLSDHGRHILRNVLNDALRDTVHI